MNPLKDPRFWLAFAIGMVIGLVLRGEAACADTLGPVTPTGTSITVTLPVAPVGPAIIRLNVTDPDYADEGRLLVNSAAPIVMFGTQLTGDNGRRDVEFPTAALVAGPNTIAWTHRTGASANGYFRVNSVTIVYAAPVVESAWVQAAKGLEAQGWVPPWLSPDDDVWVVSREDTEPSRVMACATDRATGARAAVWFDALLERLPTGQAPAADSCSLSWCFASGPGRAAAIREACQ